MKEGLAREGKAKALTPTEEITAHVKKGTPFFTTVYLGANSGILGAAANHAIHVRPMHGLF